MLKKNNILSLVADATSYKYIIHTYILISFLISSDGKCILINLQTTNVQKSLPVIQSDISIRIIIGIHIHTKHNIFYVALLSSCM